MKYLVIIITAATLISCKKENINPWRKKTRITLTTTNAVSNQAINNLNCRIIKTHHKVVSDDEVISTGTTINGRTELSFTHNSYNDYDLEVDAGDLILLNGKIPKIDLGEENQIDLAYSKKADLNVELNNSNQGSTNGSIWFQITYNNYPSYEKSNSIPTEGIEYHAMPGSLTYDYTDVPAGNYTIEWDIQTNDVTTNGSDNFTVKAGENFTYELDY